jgi:hypothetical protein
LFIASEAKALNYVSFRGAAEAQRQAASAASVENDLQQTSDVQCNRCPVAEWLAYAD